MVEEDQNQPVNIKIMIINQMDQICKRICYRHQKDLEKFQNTINH